MSFSRAYRLAGVLVLSAAWLVLCCVPAMAHAGIIQREPDKGASLSQAPRQIKITFNEPVEAAFDPLKVYATGGERVDRENARNAPGEPEAVIVDLEDLPTGVYTVDYRVTSVDGHVVDGDYDFRVKAGPGQQAQGNAGERQKARDQQEPVSSSREDSGGSNFAYVVLGLVILAALALVVVRALRRRKT